MLFSPNLIFRILGPKIGDTSARYKLVCDKYWSKKYYSRSGVMQPQTGKQILAGEASIRYVISSHSYASQPHVSCSWSSCISAHGYKGSYRWGSIQSGYGM